MAVRVKIRRPVDIPGGVNAPTTVNAPTLLLHSKPQPATVNAPATVLQPSLNLGGTLAPAMVNAPTAVLAPTLIISKTIAVESVNAPAFTLKPTLLISEDLVLTPLPANAPASVLQPTLIGDLYVHVVDPPWNVTNILLRTALDKADAEVEDVTNLIGTILWAWKNGWDGSVFNITGGNIIESIDGLLIDEEDMFDACYTVITLNPHSSVASDIIVHNLDELFELDLVDSTIGEAAELLAAILGREGILREHGSEVCASHELLTDVCVGVGYGD